MISYGTNCSLDGYIEDTDGKFDWAFPSDEVHRFWNDFMRPIDTYLYGRRLYETMAVWETLDDPDPTMRDFAEIWRAAEKVVYSGTLDEVASARTRIEREFDPAALDDGRRMSVGGAGLAASAFAAGVVDEIDLVIWPVIIGGGKPAFPSGVRTDLKLVDERRFENGAVHLHYAR